MRMGSESGAGYFVNALSAIGALLISYHLAQLMTLEVVTATVRYRSSVVHLIFWQICQTNVASVWTLELRLCRKGWKNLKTGLMEDNPNNASWSFFSISKICEENFRNFLISDVQRWQIKWLREDRTTELQLEHSRILAISAIPQSSVKNRPTVCNVSNMCI